MSCQENDKIIEAAYERTCEAGYGPWIDDGYLCMDLEAAFEYLTNGNLPCDNLGKE